MSYENQGCEPAVLDVWLDDSTEKMHTEKMCILPTQVQWSEVVAAAVYDVVLVELLLVN